MTATIQIILFLLGVLVLVAVVAQRLKTAPSILLVVAGMRDEPLPKAAALVRSSLIERGAAVEVALGPLDRAALAAVARLAAGRPLRPATLGAIERSAALGLIDWSVSLSHTHEHAMAQVVATG